MDSKDLAAEVSILLDEMEGEQGDRHEIYLRVRQLLNNLKAVGMPAPDNLVCLEREPKKCSRARQPRRSAERRASQPSRKSATRGCSVRT
jgi:hypothetical protein